MSIIYVCKYCGGENLLWDASSQWDKFKQKMVLTGVHDNVTCEDCNDDTEAVEKYTQSNNLYKK